MTLTFIILASLPFKRKFYFVLSIANRELIISMTQTGPRQSLKMARGLKFRI